MFILLLFCSFSGVLEEGQGRDGVETLRQLRSSVPRMIRPTPRLAQSGPYEFWTRQK